MENPLKYVKSILDQDIRFFDYKKLDANSWQAYYNDAIFISKNETFCNEIHHLMKDLMEKAAVESENFDQVLHLRTAMITLETFKKRLEMIEDPTKHKPNEEPYSAI